MSDEIKITMAEVANSANQLRVINNQLDAVLSNITSNMNSLSAVWDASSSETIVANFKRFANRFTKESETIEEYARFLDTTASSYDNLETTLTSNAQNFEE